MLTLPDHCLLISDCAYSIPHRSRDVKSNLLLQVTITPTNRLYFYAFPIVGEQSPGHHGEGRYVPAGVEEVAARAAPAVP